MYVSVAAGNTFGFLSSIFFYLFNVELRAVTELIPLLGLNRVLIMVSLNFHSKGVFAFALETIIVSLCICLYGLFGPN